MKKDAAIQVTIIIPNYNGLSLLKRFLQSNYRLAKRELGTAFEIIIADDNSSDGSAEYIESLNFKEIILLKNTGKRGFGGNCNHAAGTARGDFLFFLNSDVELERNCFKPMLAAIKKPNIFAVVPRIIRPLENNMVESLTGGEKRFWNIHLEMRNVRGKDESKTHQVLWACGAAFLCRKKLFTSLGGFSRVYNPYYVEDVDLSFRAWRCGYKSLYIGAANVKHFHNSTMGKTEKNQRVKDMKLRNTNIFLIRHFSSSYPFYVLKVFFLNLLRLNLKQLAFLVRALNRLVFTSLFSNPFSKKMKYVFSGKQVLKKFNQPIPIPKLPAAGKGKYDLTVAYRIYPKISKDPFLFDEDKLALADFCLKSFKESLGSLKVKMLVILDNCPLSYEKIFKKYFPARDLVLIRTEGEGNLRTFSMQIEMLLRQQYADLVYLAEDDYYYFPDTFPSMMEFIKQSAQVDFISPYDHLDTYTYKLHDYSSELQYCGGQHWRDAGSTCLTFLTSKKTLGKTKKVLLKYSKGEHDATIWFMLTKKGLFNFGRLIGFAFKHPLFYRILSRAWSHNFFKVVFGKKYRLWNPVPTIATHMESQFMSPGIDWHKHFRELQRSKKLRIRSKK